MAVRFGAAAGGWVCPRHPLPISLPTSGGCYPHGVAVPTAKVPCRLLVHGRGKVEHHPIWLVLKGHGFSRSLPKCAPPTQGV